MSPTAFCYALIPALLVGAVLALPWAVREARRSLGEK